MRNRSKEFEEHQKKAEERRLLWIEHRFKPVSDYQKRMILDKLIRKA